MNGDRWNKGCFEASGSQSWVIIHTISWVQVVPAITNQFTFSNHINPFRIWFTSKPNWEDAKKGNNLLWISVICFVSQIRSKFEADSKFRRAHFGLVWRVLFSHKNELMNRDNHPEAFQSWRTWRSMWNLSFPLNTSCLSFYDKAKSSIHFYYHLFLQWEIDGPNDFDLLRTPEIIAAENGSWK